MDDFIQQTRKVPDVIRHDLKEHSTGKRVSTSYVVVSALKSQYPDWQLSVCSLLGCDVLGFAEAGFAKHTPIDSSGDRVIKSLGNLSRYWSRYHDAGPKISLEIAFGFYFYQWNNHDFLVYLISGSEGSDIESYYYILSKPPTENRQNSQTEDQSMDPADKLIATIGRWMLDVHDEVFVFDHGCWTKSKDLWRSMKSTTWEDVILADSLKDSLRHDVNSFFDSEKFYGQFNVPWKRGLILHGPPGNGKTISIRAIMHSLMDRDPPIPTLYVKSITIREYVSEVAVRNIFRKARQVAPCLLLFEDVDSLITDRVRSFFLNEVDGLEDNNGILMVATTNHLNKLDPALAKRPSRFDRKYAFSQPSEQARIQYCEQWRQKLSTNPSTAFPPALCKTIARHTADFSFAYIKEAFIATMLTSAARQAAGDELVNEEAKLGDMENSLLWKNMKSHIDILRAEMGSGGEPTPQPET